MLAIRRRARHTISMAVTTHGHFLAAEVGELAGVSGTTIGQWARRGYIRSSASDGEPRVYSVEDVAEAAIVGELRRRGVPHVDVRRAIERLAEEYGEWPLSEAPLGTTAERGRPRIVLRERDGLYALSPRGWQRIAAPPAVEEVRLRLKRALTGPTRAIDRAASGDPEAVPGPS
jgi:DNA-binding transcriptional MerR regulator